MKKANVNENVKESQPKTPKSIKDQRVKDKKKEEVKKESETTVRNLSNGDPSILEDLGFFERMKREKEKDIEYNKKYGFDVPFINDIMNSFNKYLNEEGKKFVSTAEESLNKPDVDNDENIYIKLILGNDSERVLFKELLFNTKYYPISISVGDYDFFFERFDDGKDSIFYFNKQVFSFFFDNDLEKLKTYLKENKLQMGSTKFNNKITFDDLKIEIVDKSNTNNNKQKEEPINESEPTSEPVEPLLKKTYKLKLNYSDEFIFIVTDNPAEIFNRFGTDSVLSIELIGNGVSI